MLLTTLCQQIQQHTIHGIPEVTCNAKAHSRRRNICCINQFQLLSDILLQWARMQRADPVKGLYEAVKGSEGKYQELWSPGWGVGSIQTVLLDTVWESLFCRDRFQGILSELPSQGKVSWQVLRWFTKVCWVSSTQKCRRQCFTC